MDNVVPPPPPRPRPTSDPGTRPTRTTHFADGGLFPLKLSISLWSINNWFRFTGFRVFFSQTRNEDDPEDYETRIGVIWWGSPFNDGSKNKGEQSAV